MQAIETKNFLKDTIKMVTHIESSFLELGIRLQKISDEKLYVGEYEHFQDFLQAANIKPALASKLISVTKTFVVDNQVPPEKLATIGYSKLYSVVPFVEKDGLELALAKAETLTRDELEEEKRQTKVGEHTHTPKDKRLFAFCGCGKLMEVHETN